MSKYEHLWKWIRDNGTDSFKLTYAEIEEIAGVPIDHSFLKYKKHSIFVINVGGYIGESTKSEIEYARANGKQVLFLESER